MTNIASYWNAIAYYLKYYQLKKRLSNHHLSDYDIIMDLKAMGLLNHNNLALKINSIAFYLDWLRLFLILFALNNQHSSILCNPTKKISEYSAPIFLFTYLPNLGAYLISAAFLKATKEMKNRKWLRIYRKKRAKTTIKYISDDDWLNLRKIVNKCYILTWFVFKVTSLITFSSFWIFPLTTSDAFCNPIIWITCILSAIYNTYNFLTVCPLTHIFMSYNVILKYRLMSLNNKLNSEENITDQVVRYYCQQFMTIYRDFQISSLFINAYVGNIYLLAFSLTTVHYTLGYLVESSNTVKYLMTYFMLTSLLFGKLQLHFFSSLPHNQVSLR